MKIEFIPTDRFTIDELTKLYNQTRVDYLVPMPMNPERLAQYVHDFDVDLSYSCVARNTDGQILGLSMLGVRPGKTWITRLGVLPVARQQGIGSTLMDCMLENAENLGTKGTYLEVIKNNTPAHNLFLQKGFQETSEYLVMRRAPHHHVEPAVGTVDWLNSNKALEVLQTYPNHITWINAFESMRNSPDVEGLRVKLSDGSTGWAVYRNIEHPLRFTIGHLIMHTELGDPEEVGRQILLNLYNRYPHHDTYAENIARSDPHLSALRAQGFFENFARIEMYRKAASME